MPEAHVDSTAVEDFTWETERYTLAPDQGDVADIAQVLYDSGLLLLVNTGVLHPHGLALGVTAENGKVTGLNLHRTSDPAGVWFDEATTERARQKLVTSGIVLSPQARGCKG